MKRTLALMGMTLAVCALAGAQENTGNRVVIPPRNGARPRVVDAALIRGSIRVTAGSGTDVIAEIPGVRREDSRVPPGMHRIDAPWRNGIRVEETNDAVHIRVGLPGEENGLVLTVPVNTSLKVHTTHGVITVTGVHGEIDAASVHGDITLTNVAGTVLANTVQGSIRAGMDSVDQSKPLSFSTLNGNIDVTLPANVGMNLKLKADRGDIWSDFDVKLAGGGAISAPPGRSLRNLTDRSLRGTINGGGVDATFYTVNGRITIHKK